MKFVYVAGPITSNPLVNTHEALKVGGMLLDNGVIPFVPHLTCFWEMVEPRSYEDWMQYDFEIIKRCDGLLRLDGVSPGADREVAHARSLDIPVFYGISELLQWATPQPDERNT